MGLTPLVPLQPISSPESSLDAQEASALQDALSAYQQAANDGVPNMGSKIASAQSALNSINASPSVGSSPVPGALNPASTGSQLTPAQIASSIATGAAAIGAPSGMGGAGTVSSFLQQLFGATTGTSGGLTSSTYLIRGVAILGGLILIAGAVFGFKELSQTTVNTVRRGVEAGTVVAA